MQPLLRSVDTVKDAPPCRAMCQQLYLRQFHLQHRCHVEMGQKSDWQRICSRAEHSYVSQFYMLFRRADCYWIKVFEGVITVFDLCVAVINVPDDNIIFRSTTEDETISHHPKRHGRHITMVTSEFKGRLQETLKLDWNVNFNFFILYNNVVLLNVTNDGTHFTVILNSYINSFHPQKCKTKSISMVLKVLAFTHNSY